MKIVEYEEDTARIKRVMFASAWRTYGYLPGIDLKSSLTVGTATAAATNTAFTAFNVADVNPFRFSLEYAVE